MTSLLQKTSANNIDKQQSISLLNTYSINTNENKEKYGEVYTPELIINNMLDTLPIEIWRNKNIKWFDPTSGNGNFMIYIYFRLMESIPYDELITDDIGKSAHIIKNMLFFNDTNLESVNNTKFIFSKINTDVDVDVDVDINIENNDFLTTEYSTLMDIIVQNPPYNLNGTKEKGKKNVFTLFVDKSLKILKPHGYLLTIHPSSYRISNYSPKGTKINLNNLYTSLQIHNICMFTITQTYELMNVQINVDYLLVENCLPYKPTIIEDIYGNKINREIKTTDNIPNFGFSILDKLKNVCNQVGDISQYIYRSSELHHSYWKNGKIKTGEYPIIHLLKNSKKGNVIYYSNIKHKHQNTPKIIVNGLGVKYVLMDKEGIYGITDSPIAILNTSELLVEFLNNKIFVYLINTLGIIGNNISREIFTYIPDLVTLCKKGETFDLYKKMGFTKQEINDIEKFNTNSIQNNKLKHRL